jgi:uncharacterized protein YxjI
LSADAFAHDRFLIEQLVRPMVNLYQVTPLAVGETPAGGPIAYVRQKRMAIKEDIRFFADEQESQELFRIKARSMFDMGGARYDVTDAAGSPIGVLEHEFRKSLLRSTWKVTDGDGGEVLTAQERSLPMAIARRVTDLIPYAAMLPIPYNFDLMMDGQVVGHMNRKFQLRDRYVLDLSGDRERKLDRRLAISLAIGLDTLQNR